MDKPIRLPNETQADWRVRRNAYADYLTNRKTEHRVKVIVKEVPGPERIVEKVVKDPALSDTLARMEAVAAKTAQPGANVPERIKEFMDDNKTVQQNREDMLRRLSDLGNLIQMGLGTPAHEAEYAAYNASMDWLRGG